MTANSLPPVVLRNGAGITDPLGVVIGLSWRLNPQRLEVKGVFHTAEYAARAPAVATDSPPVASGSPGPGNGWPAFIRSQLACGAYTVAGRQVVDGTNAIKITGQTGRPALVLFVDPATYLPVQLNVSPLRISFQWLPATPTNLAQLKAPVPAGFQQVPPPAQVNRLVRSQCRGHGRFRRPCGRGWRV